MNGALLQSMMRLTDVRTSDAELLDRFRADRDERAFEELVRRHGPLVWSVCRHLLPHHADAEDAFQAVFLALVRGAGAIRAGQALPAWLHGVAVRVAAKVKRGAVRRRQREQRVSVPEADRSVPDGTWSALMAAVHEEVRQLPDAERTAFVLCDLEGVRQPDAAARLGWPLGTLSGRLCKARQRLLEQLTRRGIAPGVLALGGITTTAGTVPAALLKQVSSFPAAKAGVSSTVAELARGLVEGVTMRTKVLAATLLAAGALGVGGGAIVLSKADAQSSDVIYEVSNLLGGQGAAQPPGGSGSNSGSSSGSSGGAFPGGSTFPGGGAFPAGPPASQNSPRGGGGGGGGGNSGGGGAAAMGAPAGMAPGNSPVVEYKFVDQLSDSRDQFVKAITEAGRDGWEYCGSERLRVAGDRMPLVLVFKKARSGPFSGPAFSGVGGMMGQFSGLLGGEGGPPMGMPSGGGGRLFSGSVGGNPGGEGRGALGGTGRAGEGPARGPGPGGAAGGREEGPQNPFGGGSGRPASGGPPTGSPGPGGQGFGGAGLGGAGFGGGLSSPVPFANPAVAGPAGGPKLTALNVIALKYAQADEIVVVLKKVFPSGEFTPDSRSNQLIVRVGEKDLDDFDKLIQRLDIQSSKPK